MARPKIFACAALRENGGLCIGKNSRGISGNKGKLDNLEKIRTDDVYLICELTIPHRHGHAATLKMNSGLDLGELGLHRVGHGELRFNCELRGLAGNVPGHFGPVEILRARNPPVVRKLVAHEQDDEDRASEPHRQARDIDEAIELVASGVEQRQDLVVEEHRLTLTRTAAHGWDWRGPRGRRARSPWPRRSPTQLLLPPRNKTD